MKPDKREIREMAAEVMEYIEGSWIEINYPLWPLQVRKYIADENGECGKPIEDE